MPVFVGVLMRPNFKVLAKVALQLWGVLRKLFRCGISQTFIPLWFATGVGMALTNKFFLGYVFFILFGIWGIGCWFASDHLAKKQSNIERLRKKATKPNAKAKSVADYRKAQKVNLICYKFGVPIVLTALMLVCIAWVRSTQEEYELNLSNEWLFPANDKSPPSDCFLSADDLILYVGRNASISNKFPHTVIQYKGQGVLVIDRNEKKQAAVTVTAIGRDGKVIATIDRNHFNLTQNALQTHEPRPDKSTLLVYDEYDNQVLNVRYLNPQAIRISGMLYYGGQRIDMPIQGSYNNCTRVYGADFMIE
jgi:hypothetical protein